MSLLPLVLKKSEKGSTQSSLINCMQIYLQSIVLFSIIKLHIKVNSTFLLFSSISAANFTTDTLEMNIPPPRPKKGKDIKFTEN